jgi:hypothetical protein
MEFPVEAVLKVRPTPVTDPAVVVFGCPTVVITSGKITELRHAKLTVVVVPGRLFRRPRTPVQRDVRKILMLIGEVAVEVDLVGHVA